LRCKQQKRQKKQKTAKEQAGNENALSRFLLYPGGNCRARFGAFAGRDGRLEGERRKLVRK
jgi:hypothetical protein